MNLAQIVMGLGALMGGVKSLRDGLSDSGVAGPNIRQSPVRRARQAVGNIKADTLPTEMKTESHEVQSLDDRIKYIKTMIYKGREHPIIRKVTVQILSRKCGNGWCTPEKNHKAEIKAIFDAVRSKIRYVRDTYNKDLYQHPVRTLEFGGGDCFPHGTLVLTRSGLEEIQRLEPGDEIHDGEKWVGVVKTWERGPKDIIRFDLNNGCSLRLSGTHKVLRVHNNEVEEVLAEELRVGDDLLQPRGFSGASDIELSEDDAFLVGAYIAEGCRINHRPGQKHREVSLAGVANGKGIRERAIEILDRRGIAHRDYEREIRFSADDVPFIYDLGRIASEKHLSTFCYGPKTVAAILRAMEMGDAGVQGTGNTVYSTISRELAIQYRVLQRMMGHSTSLHVVEDHGGFGKHPIYRVTVRREDQRRPWAKIKAITVEEEQSECCDIMTETGKVYLPESDVITRQCDDYSIVLASMLQSVGYPVKLRVIRTKDADDWNHIYVLVGLPPRQPTEWISLDGSVEKAAGWEAPKDIIAEIRDFSVE